MVRRQVDRVRPLDQDLGGGCILRNVNRNIFFCGDALATQVLRWNNILKTFSHQNLWLDFEVRVLWQILSLCFGSLTNLHQ